MIRLGTSSVADQMPEESMETVFIRTTSNFVSQFLKEGDGLWRKAHVGQKFHFDAGSNG